MIRIFTQRVLFLSTQPDVRVKKAVQQAIPLIFVDFSARDLK